MVPVILAVLTVAIILIICGQLASKSTTSLREGDPPPSLDELRTTNEKE